MATKVVLRAGGVQQDVGRGTSGQQWDHVFQQSGLLGSAVVFHNGDATNALESLLPRKLNDALAVTFCTDLPSQGQEAGREAVRKIAPLQLHRELFVQQAEALKTTNPVYAAGVAEINQEILTEWLAGEDSAVPPVVLDCVVTVPVGQQGPGEMKQQGPAEATEGRQESRDGFEQTTVFAMEPQVSDYNESQNEVATRVATLLSKLEELEQAGARSVALEMESLVEEETTLIDYIGRKRILDLCKEVHESCQKLSGAECRRKLEGELRDAVMGKSRWAQSAAEDQRAVHHLFVARAKKPLSLWDWKIWSMAKPRLWRYGDASNLYDREVPLATAEWAATLLLRAYIYIYVKVVVLGEPIPFGKSLIGKLLFLLSVDKHKIGATFVRPKHRSIMFLLQRLRSCNTPCRMKTNIKLRSRIASRVIGFLCI